MTPSRAFLTSGVSVLIFMPGPAGMAHEATGLGLFSTYIQPGFNPHTHSSKPQYSPHSCKHICCNLT